MSQLISSCKTGVIIRILRGLKRETAWELGLGVTMCVCVSDCTQVVYNVGLCICLFDITKLEDAYVFPGDGASHTKGGYPLFLGHWVLGTQCSVGGCGSGGDLEPSPDCQESNGQNLPLSGPPFPHL